MYKWVMSRAWHICICLNESHPTYQSVTSHVWMRHVTRINEACHMYEWVTKFINGLHVFAMFGKKHTSLKIHCKLNTFIPWNPTPKFQILSPKSQILIPVPSFFPSVLFESKPKPQPLNLKPQTLKLNPKSYRSTTTITQNSLCANS